MEKRVKQLSITADEMDRRQSAARRLNRNENNRLRRQHEEFRDNHDLVATEIDQEMKKIQNELHGIREITGYEGTSAVATAARISGDESAANKSNSKRKRKQSQRTTTVRQRRSTAIETGKSRRRSTRDEETSVVGNKVKFHGHSLLMPTLMVSGDNFPRNLDTTTHTNNAPDQIVSSTRRVTRVSFSNMAERGKLPQLAENAASDSRSFIELDVDEARTQARKRILGRETTKGNAINHEENEESAITDDDVESYMYVPPDGRKRTVYLIPPLEDLLKEARKARYLRMPKRLLATDEEDQEKELSVDEIFSKQV